MILKFYTIILLDLLTYCTKRSIRTAGLSDLVVFSINKQQCCSMISSNLVGWSLISIKKLNASIELISSFAYLCVHCGQYNGHARIEEERNYIYCTGNSFATFRHRTKLPSPPLIGAVCISKSNAFTVFESTFIHSFIDTLYIYIYIYIYIICW